MTVAILKSLFVSPFSVFGLLTGTSAIVFGAFVFVRSSNRRIARAWLLFSLAVVVWGFTSIWVANARTPEEGLRAWRWAYAAGIIWIPVAFFRFVCLFCDIEKKQSLIVQTSIAIFFVSIVPTHLFFPRARLVFSSLYYGLPGPLYVACIAWWIWLIVYSHWQLWLSLQAASEIKKNQLRYFFLATAVGFTGGIAGFLPKLNIADVYPWGYVTTSIYPVIMSYAIVKYNLMDVRIFIRRAALLIGLYVGLVIVAGAFLLVFQVVYGRNFSVGEWGEMLTVSAVLSVGPFLYASFVKRSAYFHEATLAGITHEMKSPLAAIESAVALLRDHPNSQFSHGQDTNSYLEMIQRNTDRLRQFVDTFLTTSSQHTDVELHRTPTVMQGIVRDVVTAYEPFSLRKGLNISVDMPKGPIIVEVDKQKIEQALSNVVSNAVKFSDKGLILIKVQSSYEEISITIEDEGCGIPEPDLRRVFDRFFQGQRHRASSKGGTGLGLFLAKLWIERHGGAISASPRLDRGSQIRITLPI